MNHSLHNVAETLPLPDGGVRFQRVPETVRLSLNEHARERMLDVVGTEIRFVLEGPQAEVHLHSVAGTGTAQVFFGDFRVNEIHLVGPELRTITVKRPDWFLSLDPQRLAPLTFAPSVCRVFLAGGAVCFHGVTGAVRPPTPAELPARRLIAYGTSIAQGAGSSNRHLCYVSQTAMRLRMDAINLGSANSCHCEPALADYIAGRDDWDWAILELSTNMTRFPLSLFRERAGYFVNKVAGTGRKVACLTLFPKTADLGPDHQSPNEGGTPEQYRQVLRNIVAGKTNVKLCEGRQLLPGWRGLSADLLHPTDYGHTIIAENLAKDLAS